MSAVALIWQGNMLDLMGKRRGTISIYEKSSNMNVKGSIQHDQFGLKYQLSFYAAERIKRTVQTGRKPFEINYIDLTIYGKSL